MPQMFLQNRLKGFRIQNIDMAFTGGHHQIIFPQKDISYPTNTKINLLDNL